MVKSINSFLVSALKSTVVAVTWDEEPGEQLTDVAFGEFNRLWIAKLVLCEELTAYELSFVK